MSIKIDLKIFLFAILFWLTKQIEIYAIVMIFAFLHEIAHFLCGLILGFKAKSIKITPFGFEVYFRSNKPKGEKKIKQVTLKKMAITLAGPLCNILIALVAIALQEKAIISIKNIIYANILLAIFNLLPIYPLDGGRLIQQYLLLKAGRKKSYETTFSVSKITVIILTAITSILILYVHNIAFLCILAYLWYLVIKNEKTYKIRQTIEKQVEMCCTKKL